ncbi:MAG: glycosyltransferase family 9 protein [Flavobacteriales bacterium]|nr:glycosyltransferase family 9 protein [Flavobacteriales bacterium]
MKILVIRLSSIGDVLLTSPLLRAIKQQRPDIEIDFLTKRRFLDVIRENPNISRCHYFDQSLSEIVPLLTEGNYDLVIDLHKNFRSARVKRAVKSKSHSFPKLNIRKWLLVQGKINVMPDIHVVDRYFKAARSLGVKPDNHGLDFYLDPTTTTPEEILPPLYSDGYLGVVIGAQHETKCMPPEGLAAIIRKINKPTVLLGGSMESEKAEIIMNLLPQAEIYNACGNRSLMESARLVRHARCLVTHDTGLMHVGAAFQVPMAVLWGNTVPAFGMGPYYGKHSNTPWFSAEVKELRCRPCSKIGFDSCPKKHFKCMVNQDTEAIATFCLDIMN